jgi:flagellar basal-body rod modification protein FlgD
VVETPGAAAIALRVSPNPSRDGSVIALTLPAAGAVRVTIVDLGGRVVREVVAATLPAGEHTFRWDGRDGEGRRIAAGVYFAAVTAAGRNVSTPLVRMN